MGFRFVRCPFPWATPSARPAPPTLHAAGGVGAKLLYQRTRNFQMPRKARNAGGGRNPTSIPPDQRIVLVGLKRLCCFRLQLALGVGPGGGGGRGGAGSEEGHEHVSKACNYQTERRPYISACYWRRYRSDTREREARSPGNKT